MNVAVLGLVLQVRDGQNNKFKRAHSVVTNDNRLIVFNADCLFSAGKIAFNRFTPHVR
jgi:hypothetical protein